MSATKATMSCAFTGRSPPLEPETPNLRKLGSLGAEGNCGRGSPTMSVVREWRIIFRHRREMPQIGQAGIALRWTRVPTTPEVAPEPALRPVQPPALIHWGWAQS